MPEFLHVTVRYSAGEGVTDIPPVLIAYCAEMQTAMPSLEPYLPGEPDLNRATLHSSARFRDALVRIMQQANLLTNALSPEFRRLAVNWRPESMAHEISADGLTWQTPTHVGIRFSVTYTPTGMPPRTVFMGLHFSIQVP